LAAFGERQTFYWHDCDPGLQSDHFFKPNWPEWVTSYAKIEAAAEIQLRKNQYAYRTATLEAKGSVPEILKQILTTAGGA